MVVGGYDLAPASEDCEGTWIDQCRNTRWGTLRLKFTVTEVAVMRKSSTIKVSVFRIDAIRRCLLVDAGHQVGHVKNRNYQIIQIHLIAPRPSAEKLTARQAPHNAH